MTKLPLEAHRTFLEALSVEGAKLLFVPDRPPMIYAGMLQGGIVPGEGVHDHLNITWDSSRIVAVSAVKHGFCAELSSVENCPRYEISEHGREVLRELRTEFEQMNQRISDLEVDLKLAKAEIDSLREQVPLVPEEVNVVTPDLLSQKLTPTEAKLFEALAVRPGQLHTKSFLCTAAMSEDAEPKILDVYVCKLRQKLAKHAPEYTIQTFWGRGYAINVGDTENA